MSKGIYKYTDLETGGIIYIGKDSYIDKNKRHSDDVNEDDLNMLEISFIERYNPRFNFTKGGDGCTGRKCSIETRKKISEANTGKKHSDETKQKISENITRYWEGKTRPNESKIKMSEAHNTSGYYNVTKQKNKQYKRGFIWRYTYYEDGKQKTITSVSLEKLEQKVKARELKWLKIETEENQ